MKFRLYFECCSSTTTPKKPNSCILSSQSFSTRSSQPSRRRGQNKPHLLHKYVNCCCIVVKTIIFSYFRTYLLLGPRPLLTVCWLPWQPLGSRFTEPMVSSLKLSSDSHNIIMWTACMSHYTVIVIYSLDVSLPPCTLLLSGEEAVDFPCPKLRDVMQQLRISVLL